MQQEGSTNFNQAESQNWICPNLSIHWDIISIPESEQVILQAKQTNDKHSFSVIEGYALQYFIGKFTVQQINEQCHQKFGAEVSPDLVFILIEKLINLGVLAVPKQVKNDNSKNSSQTHINAKLYHLKSAAKWIWNPDGYWLLRLQHSDNISYIQISNSDKKLILQLDKLPLDTIATQFQVSPEYLQYLVQILAFKGFLEGTEPAKPKKRFSPSQLLFFKFRLFNPDKWLTVHIDKIRFIFTSYFGFLLCSIVAFAVAIGISRQGEINTVGQQIWSSYGSNLIFPFALLMMVVISIHELGHAFTLKHYQGSILEMGLMFICFLPGAYTNSTDAYGLVKRKQRALVIAAGVICQVVIWAIALIIWSVSLRGSWLYTTSYLLMVAAQFTLALNLNPLYKFDGYYILEALTGINHLRQRAFQFYSDLWHRKTSPETSQDAFILAIYAPVSLIYIVWVFGRLLLWIWSLWQPYLN
ncbi:MAG TPA: M50 family metallopeptidase [Nostocaceae cyanobacterium]|nr:M50 family metallopeptidase [Nostocaceae cyanobacterium]